MTDKENKREQNKYTNTYFSTSFVAELLGVESVTVRYHSNLKNHKLARMHGITKIGMKLNNKGNAEKFFNILDIAIIHYYQRHDPAFSNSKFKTKPVGRPSRQEVEAEKNTKPDYIEYLHKNYCSIYLLLVRLQKKAIMVVPDNKITEMQRNIKKNSDITLRF